MRLPQIGQIVLVQLKLEGQDARKQLPAIILEVEDVDHGKPVGVHVIAFYHYGTMPTLEYWLYQGNEVGEWQWPDIPLPPSTV